MRHLRHSNLCSQSGFTLVELAIAIIIIGLLVTSVLAGRDLISSAQTRALIGEIEGYQTAFNSFTEKYRAYPGDYRLASTKITGAVDGNGDTHIDWTASDPNEGSSAWDHMALAGYIGGSYDPDINDATAETTAPTSLNAASGYGIDHELSTDGDTTDLGNIMILGAFDGAGINDTEVLTTVAAEAIDAKMDDGQPDSGVIFGEDGNGGTCRDSGEYDIDGVEEPNCILKYKLD